MNYVIVRGANFFELIIKKNYQMSSFGGAYGKVTSDYVNAAKDAINTPVGCTIPLLINRLKL